MFANILSSLKKILHKIAPVLIACIFLGAVWLLYREISKYSLSDIKMSLAQISTGSILLALFLAALNYTILVGYDWLALKGIHKVLALPKVILVSFVGQTVSLNFGALLGGTTVRVRFYSGWGFSPMEIVRLVLMLAIAFWIGALGLIGAIFVIAPPEIPAELGVHSMLHPRPLGSFLVLIAIGYLVVCRLVHKPIHIFGKEFAFPPFRIAIAQLMVAGSDLVAAGACLYALLPPNSGVSFLEFLPSYLMAMVVVVLTHVPGGAGVLEVIILNLTTATQQNVIAALLCFRVIYYLLPLLIAAIVFALYEIRMQAAEKSGVLHNSARWMRAFAPTVMSFASFVAGMLLCFTAILPAHDTLQGIFPTWLSDGGSILAGLCGASLLFLAPGIEDRQKAHWQASLLMLAMGAVFTLIYSMNWWIVVLLCLSMVCVITVKGRCVRSASLRKRIATPRWLLFALGTLLGADGLGFALYQDDGARPICVILAEILLVVFIGYCFARQKKFQCDDEQGTQ